MLLNKAWKEGCEIEVVTKSRKSALTGLDRGKIQLTTKTVCLRAEAMVILRNARTALIFRIWSIYRECTGAALLPT